MCHYFSHNCHMYRLDSNRCRNLFASNMELFYTILASTSFTVTYSPVPRMGCVAGFMSQQLLVASYSALHTTPAASQTVSTCKNTWGPPPNITFYSHENIVYYTSRNPTPHSTKIRAKRFDIQNKLYQKCF
jgi:hypothetical protein